MTPFGLILIVILFSAGGAALLSGAGIWLLYINITDYLKEKYPIKMEKIEKDNLLGKGTKDGRVFAKYIFNIEEDDNQENSLLRMRRAARLLLIMNRISIVVFGFSILLSMIFI